MGAHACLAISALVLMDLWDQDVKHVSKALLQSGTINFSLDELMVLMLNKTMPTPNRVDSLKEPGVTRNEVKKFGWAWL